MTSTYELPPAYAACIDRAMIAAAEAALTDARTGLQRANVAGAEDQLRQATADRDRLAERHAAYIRGAGGNAVSDAEIVKAGRAVADAEARLAHARAVAAHLSPAVADAGAALKDAIARAHLPVLECVIVNRIETAAAADKADADNKQARENYRMYAHNPERCPTTAELTAAREGWEAAEAAADRVYTETWAVLHFIAYHRGCELPVQLARVLSKYRGQNAVLRSEASERTLWGRPLPVAEAAEEPAAAA